MTSIRPDFRRPPQSGRFGGIGGLFGRMGGRMGMGGYNPFMGGGFNPYQQQRPMMGGFNPYQQRMPFMGGRMGGGFNPYQRQMPFMGMGGGFNPYQQRMPFMGGFNPYQRQMPFMGGFNPYQRQIPRYGRFGAGALDDRGVPIWGGRDTPGAGGPQFQRQNDPDSLRLQGGPRYTTMPVGPGVPFTGPRTDDPLTGPEFKTSIPSPTGIKVIDDYNKKLATPPKGGLLIQPEEMPVSREEIPNDRIAQKLKDLEQQLGLPPVPPKVTPIAKPVPGPTFDPNIMVPRGQDREIPVGLPPAPIPPTPAPAPVATPAPMPITTQPAPKIPFVSPQIDPIGRTAAPLTRRPVNTAINTPQLGIGSIPAKGRRIPMRTRGRR